MERMRTIINTSRYNTRTYKEVKEVPHGYSVWGIGRENFQHPKCVPLCQEGELKYHVNTETLKFIEVESEEIALRLLDEAVRRGCNRKKFYKIIKGGKA